MIQMNITVGNQVEGLQIDDQLTGEIWPSLGDGELADKSVEDIRDLLAVSLSLKKGLGLSAAATYVNQHTTRIS